MSYKKHPRQPGYPIPGYNGHTADAVHCPRCGSPAVKLLGGFTSGQRIGVCSACGENYIVEPERKQ
jgi:uncharacterized Zn finger protein (UPF0148 family)